MIVRGGITLLAIGPPGTGKSWLLGSIGEITDDPVKLLAPKPREVNSYHYRTYGIDKNAEVFRDHAWAPVIDMYEAGAFTRLCKSVLMLYEDTEFGVVICDPLTDVVTLAAHELLMAEKAESPRDLRDSIGFYGALKYKLKGFTQALTGLASPDVARPKHILAAVHAQPTQDEDIKGKVTKEGQAKGVEFLGDALPMIEGGYRREISGEFDIVGFTSVKHGTKVVNKKMERTTEYVVQLNADSERHAKAALVPRLENKTVPNTMKAVFEALGL
jgi:hypothetical protein